MNDELKGIIIASLMGAVGFMWVVGGIAAHSGELLTNIGRLDGCLCLSGFGDAVRLHFTSKYSGFSRN